MTRMLVVLRSILYEPIVSGVSRPQWLFIAICRSPACWSPLPVGPIRCLPLFTLEISNTNSTTFVPWIYSWLQVSESVRSHLFPLIAGGGGEPSGPFFCMPCSSFFFGACSGACPTGSRIDGSDFYFLFFIFFSYVLYYIIVLVCRLPHFTVGFAGYQFLWGLET